MSALKRVALFAIGDNVHLNQLFGLHRGFREIGIDCFAGMALPSASQLALFCDTWKPDLIFEWDRSRALIAGFQESVRHAVWLQNQQSYNVRWHQGYGGSDLVYTNCLPEKIGFDLREGEYRWLFPGADDAVFEEDPSSTPILDVVFAGHMYAPISEDFLEQTFVINGQPVGEIRPLVKDFIAAGFRGRDYDFASIHAFLLEKFQRHVPTLSIGDVPAEILYVFDEMLVRLADRKRMADAVLRATRSVAFYGSPGWAQWPAYAPYYRGNLNRPRELAEAFRSAWINVHESLVSMQHRTMEVMACGRTLMVNHNSHDGTPGDIARYFTTGEDYVPYHHETLAETLAEILEDRPRMERIGRNAARRVREGHLWRHRAAQIANDFMGL